MKPIPINETNAPRRAFLERDSRKTIQPIKGTRTTLTAVKNEFFDVVVNSKPLVWKKYARNSTAPIVIPLIKSFFSICFNFFCKFQV